jgi:tRNA threonylcarbamoyladenosine biosynthesis protein TsaB
MRILAIETVETTGSVAALDNQRVLAEHRLEPTQRSAQSLAPGLAALLRQVNWRPTDVQLVSVARGPGSFTGLRIGVATAKTFAYSVGCQVLGVPTLLAIASQVPAGVRQFHTVLDAGRGELFVGQFVRRACGELAGHENTRLLAIQQWLQELAPGSVVTGPALANIVQQLPRGVTAVDRTLWAATAVTIGQVGWQMFSAGQRSDVFALVPDYFRRTAAEDEWDRKQAVQK